MENLEFKSILVSVILPVYNVEEYFDECLNSILNQTYTSWELIIIDDGSTDNSGVVADNYAKKDSRVIVVHQENKGISSARNKGLDIARGKYICFIDSDDYVELSYIERLVSQVNDDTIVCCGHRLFGKGILENSNVNNILFFDREHFLHFLIDGEIAFRQGKINPLGNFMWNKIYPKKCFEGIRFPEGRVYEDIFITMSLFSRINNFIVLPDILYHYRIRNNSIVHKVDIKKDLDYFDGLLVQEKYLRLYDDVHKMILQLLEIEYEKLFYNRYILGDFYSNEKNWQKIIGQMIEVFGCEEFSKIEAKELLRLHKIYFDCKNQVRDIERHIYDVKNGFSFRIGRILTYIPRKIMGKD